MGPDIVLCLLCMLPGRQQEPPQAASRQDIFLTFHGMPLAFLSEIGLVLPQARRSGASKRNAGFTFNGQA